MDISRRISRIGTNNKAAVRSRLEHLKRAGRQVVALNLGEPDFNTPDYIRKAAVEAIESGFTKYTPVEGILELREAICNKLHTENRMNYTPGEIIVSAGAKQAAANALFAICNEGDEVLIPIPCWDSYPEMVKLAQAKPVFVDTRENGAFILSPSKLKQKITAKTKAVILTNPHNPTGAVYSGKLLQDIGKLACEHDLYIISDEIYEYLTYEGDFLSMASISSDIKARTVTVNGLSKAFSMTGWRIGYAAGPKQVIDAMRVLQSYTTSNVNSISQKAAAAALSGSRESIAPMIREFDARRRFIIDGLKAIPEIQFVHPRGAFYILADISGFFGSSYKNYVIKNADDFAAFILDEANVMLSSGAFFQAPDYVRISYSNSMENLKLAMENIRKAISLLA